MRRKQLARMAIYTIGIVMVVLFTFETIAFAQSDLLSVHIKATAIKDESIDQVVGHLLEYGIPLGIELGNENLIPRRKITLDVPESTLEEFLNAVVAKDQRYSWKLEDGVIHLWPAKQRDNLVVTLLETKISRFMFMGDVRRSHIRQQILELPEITSQLANAGVEPLTFHGFGSASKLENGIFFDESNVRLRELLDRIVLKTEIKQWVIFRWGKNSEYITLKWS